MRNKILLSSLILIIFVGVIISLISYLTTFIEPKLIIKAEISPISDADFDRIRERNKRQ